MEEMVGWIVNAGFPSPGENWRERPLRLNDILILHPEATYFMRVRGNSMSGAGIRHGDLLIVDRALEAHYDDIVVVVLDGTFLVKRLGYRGEHDEEMVLHSAHQEYPPLLVTPEMDVVIWGVVTFAVHGIHPHVRKRLLRGRKP